MVYENIIYYLSLTFNPEVLWIIFPLFISTIIVLAYFGKYREENMGWNSLVANTLVLIFVSMSLLRYIYNFGDARVVNFILFQEETLFASAILLLGVIMLTVNFRHLLPEKLAEKVSSPITLNLVAYIGVLFVYSGEPDYSKLLYSPPSQTPLQIALSLLIIFILLLIIFHLMHNFFVKTFLHLKKIKEKEKIDNIKKEKRLLLKEKKEIRKKERKLTLTKLRELEKQKKEAIKLKKIIKK